MSNAQTKTNNSPLPECLSCGSVRMTGFVENEKRCRQCGQKHFVDTDGTLIKVEPKAKTMEVRF